MTASDPLREALSDEDKLRTLATWFDHFDDWREATNKIAPGIAEYREVQADLRRIADGLALRAALAAQPETPDLDAAWAEAEAALPEGWALWGVRFRAPSTRHSRPRGQWEAWAGPIPVEGEPVMWPRPLRGLSGYSADGPAVALGKLTTVLVALREPQP